MDSTSVLQANQLQFDGSQAPFFEAYTFEIVSPSRDWSLWIEYSLTAPLSEENDASAQVQALFWNAQEPAPYWLEKKVSLSDFDIFHQDKFIQFSNNSISLDSVNGYLQNEKHHLEWSLAFEDPTQVCGIYPPLFYQLHRPKTKFFDARLKTRVSGVIQFDRHRINLEGAIAHQSHTWGSRLPLAWVEGHCLDFAEDADALFKGLVLPLQLGPFGVRNFPFFYFEWEGTSYFANTWHSVFKNQSENTLTHWNFEAYCKDFKFMGRVTRPRDKIIGFKKGEMLGKTRYVHQSLSASIELDIYQKHSQRYRFLKKLTAQDCVQFETAQPKPHPDVTFLP